MGWMNTIVIAAALLMASPASARDRTEETVDLGDGKKMPYQLITPDGFKPDQPYPVLIVLPGGPQTRSAADAALQLFDAESRARGWVVVGVESPDNRTFFRGAQEHIPALLASVRKKVRVEGNKFHLAGISNGGISAFRLAIDHPEWYCSILALPGYPPDAADADKLKRLKGIPVRMFVGSDDTVAWKEAAKRTLDGAKKGGVDIALDIRGTQGHVMEDLTGTMLFGILEQFRVKEGTMGVEEAAVNTVLDDLHDAASKAQEARYFGLFAPDAVFIGTDSSERWTVDQFRAYAHPIFSKGKGWTYLPRNRHIDFSPGFAIFDELLDNEKYGICRGSGALRKVDGQWRIVQYHLTIPVPNDLAERVAKLIKSETGKKK